MANFRLPGRPVPAQAPADKPQTVLEQRREELRTKFTEMQWDLGGAAYEMAARDYFRLDVLAKMAAKLQVVDAELAEIERVTRLEEAGATGICAGCGSLHARGAVYCWRCGRNVAQAQGSSVVLPAGTTRPPVTPAPVPAHPAPNGAAPSPAAAAAAPAPAAASSEEAPVFHATAPPPTNPEVDLHLPDIDFEPAPTHTDLSDARDPDSTLPDAGRPEPEIPEPQMPEPEIIDPETPGPEMREPDLPDLDLRDSGMVDSDRASAPG